MNFLIQVAGRIKEFAGLVQSAGAGDAGKIPALGADGRLHQSMMPVGVSAEVKVLATTENLSAGDIVNVWNSTGEKARRADATAEGKEGIGFVLAGTTSGQNATVYTEGTITGLAGLTPGARYYLSAATPGAITATPPSANGNVIQYIGTALSATELTFEPGEPITVVA